MESCPDCIPLASSWSHVCWWYVVSRHLRKHWANSILELETKEDARGLRTVCGQKHNSAVAAPNSSFLFHHWVFIPLCPTSKAQIFTCLTWPTDWLCQKISSLNYSDGKTFRLRQEPTSFALLWSLQNFSFLQKPYWQAHQTPSTYLRFYSGFFGTPLCFTCQSISAGESPTKTCWHLTAEFHKMF